MSSDAVLPVRIDARGLDIDEAVGFYERVYASQDIHISDADPDAFSWRYRAIGDDELTFGTSSVAADRWGTINPERQYVLAWATGEGMVLDSDSRDPIVMQPGVPVMYPAGRDFAFTAAPTTQHLIRFDGDFLESVAAARTRTLPGPLRFADRADPARLQTLRSLIGAVAGRLLDPATPRADRTAMNMTVAEGVVDTFAAAPVVDFTLPDGPATMRFAQEWMVANARRPITITDISTATGIAVRSVQASFQRHTGMSPMQFLRQIRLHRVRAELSLAEAGSCSVAEVALGWGFTHLGRFAGAYAAAFGEPPSHTLRRRPPSASSQAAG
jgi:AraC-like DNA-binding protein